MPDAPIYHLVPASYYRAQPLDQPYQPATFGQEGFIHCTAGQELLIKIANAYFDTLAEELLVLEIDSQELTALLKYELPIPPTGQPSAGTANYAVDSDLLFPHIYGPLNREAIVECFALQRNGANRWQMPK